MNALHHFTPLEMQAPHLEDKMELGTSPYPPVDDIEFDFEPDRQPSIDRSMADDVEAIVTNTDNTNDMQDDQGINYNDDDMLDEETLQPPYESVFDDLNMESYSGENNEQHDEEILYDEEIGSINMTQRSDNTNAAANAAHVDNAITNLEAEDVGETEQGSGTLDDSNTDPTTERRISNNHSQDELPSENSNIQTLDTADEGHAQTDVVDFAAKDDHAVYQGHSPEEDDNTSPTLEPHHHEALEQHSKLQSHSSPSANHVTQSESQEEFQTVLEDTTVEKSKHEDKHKSRIEEPLHPVTVVYLDQEMSFFPPMVEDTSATFFLSDAALAYEPVEKLLASCRDILGETLEHDDELVLDIPALGLHICEDSKYASQITLAQVVDVYLNLSRNEDLDSIDPLYCSLSSRVCLASQYSYLLASAAEGKTYSDIAADYVDSPDRGGDSIPDGHDRHLDPATDNAIDAPRDLDDEADKTNNQNSRENLFENQDDIPHEIQDQVTNVDVNASQSGNAVPVTAEAKDPIDSGSVDIAVSSDTPPHVQQNAAHTGTETAQDNTQRSQDKQYETKHGHQSVGPTAIDVALENDEVIDFGDDQSDSSHTIEAETTLESIDPFPIDVSQANVPPFHNEDQEAQQLVDSTDAFDLDEELFHEDESEGGENFEANSEETQLGPQFSGDDQVNGHGHAEANPESNGESTYDEFDLEPGFVDSAHADENAEDFDFLQTEDAAPSAPFTPSKYNGGKRKAAIEEDDLDFLDISTPEPKRTRAS